MLENARVLCGLRGRHMGTAWEAIGATPEVRQRDLKGVCHRRREAERAELRPPGQKRAGGSIDKALRALACNVVLFAVGRMARRSSSHDSQRCRSRKADVQDHERERW